MNMSKRYQKYETLFSHNAVKDWFDGRYQKTMADKHYYNTEQKQRDAYKSFIYGKERFSAEETEMIIKRLKQNKPVGFFDPEYNRYVSYTFKQIDSWDGRAEHFIQKYRKGEITFNKRRISTRNELTKRRCLENSRSYNKQYKYYFDFFHKLKNWLKTKKVYIDIRLSYINDFQSKLQNHFYEIGGIYTFLIALKQIKLNNIELKHLISQINNDFLKKLDYDSRVSKVGIDNGRLYVKIW